MNGPRVVSELRAISDHPVRYVIYTHGHYDHAFGTPALFDDAAERGPPGADRRRPRERRPAIRPLSEDRGSPRADLRHAVRQLGRPVAGTSSAMRATTRRRSRSSSGVSLSLGDLTLDCRHGLGETDDHTWVWIPERRVIVGGDFIVSSLPNAGTPFRVQRYVLEWAETLEAMAALDARRGDQRPRRRLHRRRPRDAADHRARAALARGRGGAAAQRGSVVRADRPRGDAARPTWTGNQYLQPVYGCTAFVVHSILRRYTGWYDGNPSMLFPSTRAEIASGGGRSRRRHLAPCSRVRAPSRRPASSPTSSERCTSPTSSSSPAAPRRRPGR